MFLTLCLVTGSTWHTVVCVVVKWFLIKSLELEPFWSRILFPDMFWRADICQVVAVCFFWNKWKTWDMIWCFNLYFIYMLHNYRPCLVRRKVIKWNNFKSVKFQISILSYLQSHRPIKLWQEDDYITVDTVRKKVYWQLEQGFDI